MSRQKVNRNLAALRPRRNARSPAPSCRLRNQRPAVLPSRACSQRQYQSARGVVQTATNSMANATYLKMVPQAASRYSPALSQWRGVFTYHSERFNAGATHIPRCPGQPRKLPRGLFSPGSFLEPSKNRDCFWMFQGASAFASVRSAGETLKPCLKMVAADVRKPFLECVWPKTSASSPRRLRASVIFKNSPIQFSPKRFSCP